MDEKLRRLERKFKESGTIGDEVAFLAEKIRVGQILKEQLELASYLDYPAARVLYPTPITICSILNGSDAADTISESWEAALSPFDVLFAAAISAADAVVKRCSEGDDTEERFREILRYHLTAAIRGFGNRESPMTYGYDGGVIQQELAAVPGDFSRRRQLQYAMYCIYNLCEALDMYLMNMEDQMYNEVRMSLYNALEFFPYERDMLCKKIGMDLVPWLLSDWPPTPSRLVELNFDPLPWRPHWERE